MRVFWFCEDGFPSSEVEDFCAELKASDPDGTGAPVLVFHVPATGEVVAAGLFPDELEAVASHDARRALTGSLSVVRRYMAAIRNCRDGDCVLH